MGPQIDGIKDLHFTDTGTARIGEIAMIRIGSQCAEAVRIRRRVPNGVHHFHVAYIVNVQTFFEAYDETGTIQFDRKNCVRIRVIADFGSFFEVANLCATRFVGKLILLFWIKI